MNVPLVHPKLNSGLYHWSSGGKPEVNRLEDADRSSAAAMVRHADNRGPLKIRQGSLFICLKNSADVF